MPDRIIRADLTDISNIVTPPGHSHRKRKKKKTSDTDKAAGRKRKKKKKDGEEHQVDKLA